MKDHAWDSYPGTRLIRWGAGHSLELFYDGTTDAFVGWYVNVQEPLRRSRLGFDTDDLVLDIWIKAGRRMGMEGRR